MSETDMELHVGDKVVLGDGFVVGDGTTVPAGEYRINSVSVYLNGKLVSFETEEKKGQ